MELSEEAASRRAFRLLAVLVGRDDTGLEVIGESIDLPSRLAAEDHVGGGFHQRRLRMEAQLLGQGGDRSTQPIPGGVRELDAAPDGVVLDSGLLRADRRVSRDTKLDREIPTPGLIASRHWYSMGQLLSL